MFRLDKYKTIDRDSLIEVFQSNVPTFFDVSEEKPFLEFLDKKVSTYFVCYKENTIVGAGGYMEIEKGEARICWLMVDATIHSSGVGRFMMERFAEMIKADGIYDRITLKTTQFTDKFYEKLGYETTQFEKDFWVPGWHLYFMEKKV